MKLSPNNLDKNDLLDKMYAKAKELPIGTEISTSQLLNLISNDLNLEMSDMFSLDIDFKNNARKNGIIIDNTIHDNEVLGLPFNIGFLIKDIKQEDKR